MQIDSLGLPKYGTDDLMDLIYKGKLDMLFKVYTEDNDKCLELCLEIIDAAYELHEKFDKNRMKLSALKSLGK